MVFLSTLIFTNNELRAETFQESNIVIEVPLAIDYWFGELIWVFFVFHFRGNIIIHPTVGQRNGELQIYS